MTDLKTDGEAALREPRLNSEADISTTPLVLRLFTEGKKEWVASSETVLTPEVPLEAPSWTKCWIPPSPPPHPASFGNCPTRERP